MYRFVIFLFALFVQINAFCIDLKYSVLSIPDSLKANAKVVVRNHEEVFEILTIGKGVETVSYTYTILNENGYDYAILHIPYSQKLQKVHSIRGTVYNAAGDKIESISQDKVVDVSAISGYSLFEDHRMKGFRPKTLTYPFTVEYSYVVEYDGLMELPEWEPMMEYNISVEHSTFKMICPNYLSFRYKEKNIVNKATVIENQGTITYNWAIASQPAILEQPFSVPLGDFTPSVFTAPNNFEVSGYAGNLSNWSDYGKWISDLNEGKNVISPETKALLLEKTKDCKNDYEKAKVVYEYMQQKTRYLNITIGIGGWQPIIAETVDRLGYGDCKALSNYTKTLLEAVGIKAYYTIIYAGTNAEETDISFPTNHFNHAILCLPLSTDTLWLECTNQHIPFGYIGDFTDDRNALVITEKGGEIIHTRTYTSAENQLRRNTIIDIDPAGNASVNIQAQYMGVQYDDILETYLAGTEDKKKLILDELDIPGAILNKFNYQETRSEVPVIQENLQLDLPRFATISGPRMLVCLVPVDKFSSVPKKVNNRKSDVIIRRDKVYQDTITLSIPEGYVAETVPAEIKIETKFGTYLLHPEVQGNKVICNRKIEIRKGRYPAAEYIGLIDFYKKMATADNSKMSLKKAI
jgi:hypothetical protein